MELLRGPRALDAVHALHERAAGLLAVAVDPLAARGDGLSVLALGDTQHAVLLDATTGGLGDALAQLEPLGAFDAKPIHRLLLGRYGRAPGRWADVHLTELLIAGGRPVQLDLEAVSRRLALPTPPDPEAGFDALAALATHVARLVAAQIPQLQSDGLSRISRIEAAAVAPIAAMEHAGMCIDAPAWRRLNAEAEVEQQSVRGQLLQLFADTSGSDLFGSATVNLASDAELKQALHALGHRVPNVKRRTLEQLPAPLGPTLARYRELSKILSAYGETFLQYVGDDGRLHPTFEQIGASTGRMACHSPNLQAVVKDGPHRACFRCADEHRLVIGDYATCELRILAEMSGDPVFTAAFERGEDLHARVASSVFGKPVSKTQNPELRQRAKAVSFGLVYGMGAAGLARATQTSLDQARGLLQRYFETFPRIGRFLETSAHEALERGFAATLAGRRLYLEPGENTSSRAQAERIAKNMPIQGTSADITKIALARVHRTLAPFDDAHLVNAVHDELVVECRAADAAAVRQLLAEEMRAAGAELLRHIRLDVDLTVGQVWGK